MTLKRTHMCGQLGLSDVTKEIVVMGWVSRRRDLGGVIFVDLRDITGVVQVVFNPEVSGPAFDEAQKLGSEYVIAITGIASQRTEKTVNAKIKTGCVEIMAKELQILSVAQTPPVTVEDYSGANDAIRMKYRYIDLRCPRMQENLMVRHKAAKVARDYFSMNGFLEIETPMLIKSTPEGARDYLVPSRTHTGKFFALPQSPQLFKQLLMVSGFDKYFQIARCFRDEDLRADRQPEFTQIDIEMSFVDMEDILDVNEGFIKRLFKEVMDVVIQTPIPRLTYKEAMKRYGTDKPDVRFGLELRDVSSAVANCEFKVFSDALKNGGSVRAINAKGMADKITRREIDELTEVARTYKAKGLAWIALTGDEEVKSPISKFFTEEELKEVFRITHTKPGDLILFVADKDEVVYAALSQIRLELARKLKLVNDGEFSFVWVTEFPLLEYSYEEKRWVAIHHPFTSPMEDDTKHLDTNPGIVRSNTYDLVLNGIEIGGGGMRIHEPALQTKMFNLLGFTNDEAQSRFGFLLEAFKFGVPPHGGLAYGFDRLVMIMVGADTIRDVIAFPKAQNAACLMSGAPSSVDTGQLEELYIKIQKEI